MSFGFSVGDIVRAIELFGQIGFALKENGGAAQDFQRTLTQLEATHAVLSSLESDTSSNVNSSIVNAIKASAHRINTEVQQCLQDTARFRDSLGPNRRKGCLQGVPSKIKWSQYKGQKVNELCRTIDQSITTINVLIGMHQSFFPRFRMLASS